MFTKSYDEMTHEEKLQHLKKFVDAQSVGNMKEANMIGKTIPLYPVLASTLKKILGADNLLHGNFNLTRAEAEYGKDWLTQ